MFDNWLLQHQVKQPEGALNYEALEDSGCIGDEELPEQLGREVARNYLNPGELALTFTSSPTDGVHRSAVGSACLVTPCGIRGGGNQRCGAGDDGGYHGGIHDAG
ncbi:hypothetical protein ACWDZ6_21790 [Streptomyces sp. NPDC002926]